MNRVKKGRIADRDFPADRREGIGAVSLLLAHRLLLSKAQRAVGKVGVHPSAPMDRNTHHKRLKIKALGLFQNGAVLPSFGHGQRIGGKGKRLGKSTELQTNLARGTRIAARASK